MHIASIILDDGPPSSFDYLIPKELPVKIGFRVVVPLRSKMRKGTVVGFKNQSPYENLQSIAEIEEGSFVSEKLCKLAEWMASYYATPLSKVLELFVPSHVRKDIEMKKFWLVERTLSKAKLVAMTASLREKEPKKALVLDLLLEHPKGIFLSELLEKSGQKQSVVEALVDAEILQMRKIDLDDWLFEQTDFFSSPPKALNHEQAKALQAINHDGFAVHLLHGITGSGKTEVYLQAMERVRKKGLGVLFLVPEVSLTSQTLERLRTRFPEKIALLHHRLSSGERLKSWRALACGEIHIAIGARSAIFAPFKNLGLIIIDEEHDGAYKQTQEMPCYHARDVAIMRAKFEDVPVVLGSATPSLETFHNVLSHRYKKSVLTQRAGQAKPPHVSIIDMQMEEKQQGRKTLFSSRLLDAIKERTERGEQSLILLNRRGYFSTRSCKECHEALKCPHCDITMTYHRKEAILCCHLCGKQAPHDSACPKCKSIETMKFQGPGTEMVEYALKAILKDVRTLRMDRDTTRTKGSHEEIFYAFKSGKADVLIGTQMIAKGLHFPLVTLVGVLQGDTGLHIPDFRSSEQLFQLLAQVSGRSGRDLLQGEVFIQTHLPDHPLFHLAAKENYHAFFDQEIAERKLFDYPPFTRMCKIQTSAKEESLAKQAALTYFGALIKILPKQATIYPVTPCGHAKIKDNYRFQFLIKAEKGLILSRYLLEVTKAISLPKSVHLLIDVDPLQTFD